jgi:hypothetical protein
LPVDTLSRPDAFFLVEIQIEMPFQLRQEVRLK